ncbi:hypothetical protein J3R83DRAFT_11955 [Lanmaoa asiatica]|nr:hypothetical protein J3R83DRAFT_11955 [Lanmaoa asiatica]
MSFTTIFRASPRISRARILTEIYTSPQRTRVGGPLQGAARTLTTAATAVSSDQLGFVPNQHPTTDLPIANADDRKIAILWAPQNWSRFHHIWLRDHCRCPSCFHPVTKQRLVNTFEIPPNIRPHHVQASAEGLEVVWPASGAEYHSSVYPWSWLKAHTYDPLPKSPTTFGEKALWGAKIAKSPPTVSYADAMDESDQGLYKWLSNIDRFGFCLVSGVPATPEATEELSKRIGFIRETQCKYSNLPFLVCGEIEKSIADGKFWEFTADLSKGDTAYTTMALGAHTDNTYFTDPCGLQLFHLLSHTEGSGGATLLVDGFYVASLLKELHPERIRALITDSYSCARCWGSDGTVPGESVQRAPAATTR